MSGFFAIPYISILLLLVAVDCSNPPPLSSCPASSCGNIKNISFPFRLKTDPISCGYNNPFFELDCHNNVTVLSLQSGRYYVQEIDYFFSSIRVVDPGVFDHCPTNSLNPKEDCGWSWTQGDQYNEFYDANVGAAFLQCGNAVNSWKYIKADFCGSRPVSQFYSYVVVGEDNELRVSDVEESCVVDKITRASNSIRVRHNSSLERIYDALSYGFEIPWISLICPKCNQMESLFLTLLMRQQ